MSKYAQSGTLEITPKYYKFGRSEQIARIAYCVAVEPGDKVFSLCPTLSLYTVYQYIIYCIEYSVYFSLFNFKFVLLPSGHKKIYL